MNPVRLETGGRQGCNRDSAAVLLYRNPFSQAEGGYVVTGWAVNLAPEIGGCERRTVSYLYPNGDMLQTRDLDFCLRHVPRAVTGAGVH